MSWQMIDYPYPYEGTVSTNTANHPNPLDEYYYYINGKIMTCSWLFGVSHLLAVNPFTCGENPDKCAPFCSIVIPLGQEERQAHI